METVIEKTEAKTVVEKRTDEILAIYKRVQTEVAPDMQETVFIEIIRVAYPDGR